MNWLKTHTHVSQTNHTHCFQTNPFNTNTHGLLAENCWGCWKLLELLALPEAAGTSTRVPIETTSGCRNCSRSRKLLELLLVRRSRQRLVAGTARDRGSCWNFCSCVDRDGVWLPELLAIEEAAGTSARASIETASGCRNCSCLATGTALVRLLLVLAFGCCSCLWNCVSH